MTEEENSILEDCPSDGSASDADSEDSLSFPSVILGHRDFEMIERDVARCTWHLLGGTRRVKQFQMEHKGDPRMAKYILKMQRRLALVINGVLMDDPDGMFYYQGYHEVASVFLSTLSQRRPLVVSAKQKDASSNRLLPARVLSQVSQAKLRDFLKENFNDVSTAMHLTLPPLLARFDPHVHAHLESCEMEPFFAIPWVISWFSREIHDTEAVKRLFDAFLVSHPLMPIYVSAAMVTHPVNRQQVLEADCEFAVVHHTLSALPQNSMDASFQRRFHDDDMESHIDSVVSETTTDDVIIIEKLLRRMNQVSERGESDGSESTLSTGAIVPLQEVIDLAVEYMRKVPPSELLALANRYHGPSGASMLERAPEISLFQVQPEWATAASAPSRNAARYRWHLLVPASPDSTRSVRSEVVDLVGSNKKAVGRYLRLNRDEPSVVAAGFGPGRNALRRKRWIRRVIVLTIVSGVLVYAALFRLQWLQRHASLVIPSQKSNVPRRKSRPKRNVNPIVNTSRLISEQDQKQDTASEAATSFEEELNPCLNNVTPVGAFLSRNSYETSRCLIAWALRDKSPQANP